MARSSEPFTRGLLHRGKQQNNHGMARDYHVFDWHDEPSDERPSELMRSTGYGGLFPNSEYGHAPSTQHADLYNSQYGTFASSQLGDESGFTRPSPLPRERVVSGRTRFTELPTAVVIATIFGGAAYLIWEFARLVQR
jgi:hypothetical protein